VAKSYIKNWVMHRQSVTQYVILKHPSLVALRGTIVVGDRVSDIMFQEVYSIWQWPGVVAPVCGIFGLAVYNWRKLQVGCKALFSALELAVLSGIMVAAYTTFDT
jgi:hypothetical protein